MTYARAARSERIRLIWWKQPCSKGMAVHWARPPLDYHEVWVTVVGVESQGGTYFNPQGVLPTGRLPAMNRSEKAEMLVVLRHALIEQTGLNLHPIAAQLIDWEGQEDDL